MSEETVKTEKKELNIAIKITPDNITYKSDFSETETIFWLEAIKSIILQKAFSQDPTED